jgi:hypothetical protein
VFNPILNSHKFNGEFENKMNERCVKNKFVSFSIMIIKAKKKVKEVLCNWEKSFNIHFPFFCLFVENSFKKPTNNVKVRRSSLCWNNMLSQDKRKTKDQIHKSHPEQKYLTQANSKENIVHRIQSIIRSLF